MSKRFLFFENFKSIADKLPDDMRLKFYDALLSYVFDGVEPDDVMIAALITAIKPSLDKEDKRGGVRDGAGAPKGNQNAVLNNQNNQKQSKTIKVNQNNQSFLETETGNGNGSKKQETEEEKKNISVADCFVKQAERLAEIVGKNKKIHVDGRKINAWAKSIEQLNKIEGVAIERIESALEGYACNIGRDYVPVIESGKSFREKFTKLEAAIARNHQPWEDIEI